MLRWRNARARVAPSESASLRTPKLSQEFIRLLALKLDIEDWRTLDSAVIASKVESLEEPQKRSLWATAVYVGTAQATLCGFYYAPSPKDSEAIRVDVRHLSRPVSCFYAADRKPLMETWDKVLPHCSAPALGVVGMQGKSLLDAAIELCDTPFGRQVCVVRFSGRLDSRNDEQHYRHFHEDQLFLRTTYSEAVEHMASDANIKSSLGAALDQGGLIYTSGVGLLRGPLKEGTPWLREPVKIDVAWVALPKSPKLAFGEQYADEGDLLTLEHTLNQIMLWAAAHGADAVVMPPLGCEFQGCRHPRLAVADTIHKVARRFEKLIPTIALASDNPVHGEASWWEPYEAAVKEGRQPVKMPVEVPPLDMPSWMFVKKEPAQQLQKLNHLMGYHPRNAERHSAVRSRKGKSYYY